MKTAAAPPSASSEAVAPALKPAPVMVADDTIPETIRVSTPLFEVTLNELGGNIEHLALKKFRETVEPDSPLKELVPSDIKNGTAQIDIGTKVPGLIVALPQRQTPANQI